MGTRLRTPLCLLLLAAAAIAQQPFPLHYQSAVQDKNFYLLSLLRRATGVPEAVGADPVLARLAAARLTALDDIRKSCPANLPASLECSAAAFQWSDGQIAEAAAALSALYRKSPALRTLTDGPLRASGMYVRYNSQTGEDLLAHALADCLRGIDHAIDVYILGKPQRYPDIDSITYDPKTDSWKHIVLSLDSVLEDDRASMRLFFDSSLRFATEALILNLRDEAGRYEPMDTGENAAAFRRVKAVAWSRYPYAAIVVPGSGNERAGISLSANGRLRNELAAKRFHEGKAPFLLVSGGFVHPSRTEFAEAIEMKRDLIARLGVPADAIIVDPHARHTTTNMRNAARLMYRYGIPFGKKALVTTDVSQSTYIEDPAFAKRCTDELGYVPYKIVGRISPFDLEFLPVIDSLQADPMEPLDP